MPPSARAVLKDRRLFKFRSVADDSQRDRLRDIILGSRIRFSKPSELNDPLEGKPVYALGDWSSEQYRAGFADWAWSIQRHMTKKPPETKFREWIYSQSEDFHRHKVAQINAENHAAIEQRWRVLSLSASCTHDLLWSHYADGHRGVALIFDASYGEFAIAFQVAYVQERKTLDITSQDLDDVFTLTLLTKRDAWRYEEEFRCVGTEAKQFGALHVPSQFLSFAPPQLLGLVFGATISQENEALIRAWCTERKAPLQLFRGVINHAGTVEIHDAG